MDYTVKILFRPLVLVVNMMMSSLPKRASSVKSKEMLSTPFNKTQTKVLSRWKTSRHEALHSL
jgi:hypothetical protein